tara:strand:+ start:136 stop:699 length:564 start_codon:yes stop_codon:yes gene_type:complete
MNYYQILGVEENCTDKEIKTAFRKLSKEFHPDINKNGESDFKAIKNAYETLIDKDKRKSYDDSGKLNTNIDIDSEINAFIVEYLFEEILNNTHKFNEFMSKDQDGKHNYLVSIVNYHISEQNNFLQKKKQENYRRKLFCLELKENESCRKLYEEIINKNNTIILNTEEQIKFLNLAKTKINNLINNQ